MKYAWVVDNKIRDIAPGNPTEFYHPDVAVFYNVEVPDNAANGDGWVNGQLIKPEPPAPSAPAPRTWSQDDVRSGLTLVEKVKWDNDTTLEIKTVKTEFVVPKNQEETTELLNFLVSCGAISQESVAKVLE